MLLCNFSECKRIFTTKINLLNNINYQLIIYDIFQVHLHPRRMSPTDGLLTTMLMVNFVLT